MFKSVRTVTILVLLYSMNINWTDWPFFTLHGNCFFFSHKQRKGCTGTQKGKYGTCTNPFNYFNCSIFVRLISCMGLCRGIVKFVRRRRIVKRHFSCCHSLIITHTIHLSVVVLSNTRYNRVLVKTKPVLHRPYIMNTALLKCSHKAEIDYHHVGHWPLWSKESTKMRHGSQGGTA